MKNINLAFIGAGNMASSLINGLLSNDMDTSQITVSDVNREKLIEIENEMSVRTSLNNRSAIKDADVIVLAVKPHIVKPVIGEIHAIVAENKILVISVAAGVRERDIQTWLGGGQAIIRCMPNTPALVGAGASGMYANDIVSKQQALIADTLLQAVGITAWVEDEGLLDSVTALSGSGPAYFFLLVESMTEAGVKLGLDKVIAERLARQTAFGAAKMLHQTTTPAVELKQKVTSKGGTTEAALSNFYKADLHKTVFNSMQCAYDRSMELGLELGEKQC